jgi:hypothetical protein
MTPEERFDPIETIIEKQNQVLEKQSAGIRDLIADSRTVLTAMQETSASMRELRDFNARIMKNGPRK